MSCASRRVARAHTARDPRRRGSAPSGPLSGGGARVRGGGTWWPGCHRLHGQARLGGQERVAGEHQGTHRRAAARGARTQGLTSALEAWRAERGLAEDTSDSHPQRDHPLCPDTKCVCK